MDDLPHNFSRALQEAGTPVRVPRGRVLVDEGDSGTDVYYVREGRLRVTRVSEAGREPHLADLGPGHVFGELAAIDGQPRSAVVTALDPVELTRVSGPRFRELLRDDPEAMWWLLEQLSLRSRLLTRRTFELATLSVGQRITLEVARIAQAAAGEEADSVVLSDFPTHETLAARAGTHREAVTRRLGEMERAGLIARDGRSVSVPSVAGLMEAGEG